MTSLALATLFCSRLPAPVSISSRIMNIAGELSVLSSNVSQLPPQRDRSAADGKARERRSLALRYCDPTCSFWFGHGLQRFGSDGQRPLRIALHVRAAA